MPAKEIDRPEDLEPALKEAFASTSACLLSVNVQTSTDRRMGMDLSVNPPNYG